MSIHIYHPNKAVKGFACSFWFSDKDGSLFATLIKQAGWDERTQNGTFKASLNDPNKKVNIKLSPVEACGILDCIERNRPFTTFHAVEDAPKAISFTPWMVQQAGDIDNTTPPPPLQKGFSFSISVTNKSDAANKNSFYIGLTYAEARYVREFIMWYLHNAFNKTTYPSQTAMAPENVPAPETESPNDLLGKF